MLSVRCPKCGRAAEYPETQAGQGVACPGCGNVNALPGVAAATGAAPVAATVGPVGPTAAPPPAVPVEPAVAAAPASAAHPSGLPETIRNWAMLAHLGGLLWLFTGIGGVIAPLVIWLIQKEKSPFIDRHGKESVNFQITMLIASVIFALLAMIVVGCFLLVAQMVLMVVQIIQASMAAKDGKEFRYWLCLRLIK